MLKEHKNESFAILGLGRFGISIVKTLAEYNVDILACDKDNAKLNLITDYATHIIKADLNCEEEIYNLDLENFDVVIIAMGEALETSLITTTIAKELGVKKVIVKASNKRQEKILKTLGADEVILPEHEIGIKLAKKLVSTNILDILEESDDYTILEMTPRESWINKSVSELKFKKDHNSFFLAILREDNLIIPVPPNTVLKENDVILAISDKI